LKYLMWHNANYFCYSVLPKTPNYLMPRSEVNIII
jgi:hypothetical protein